MIVILKSYIHGCVYVRQYWSKWFADVSSSLPASHEGKDFTTDYLTTTAQKDT